MSVADSLKDIFMSREIPFTVKRVKMTECELLGQTDSRNSQLLREDFLDSKERFGKK